MVPDIRKNVCSIRCSIYFPPKTPHKKAHVCPFYLRSINYCVFIAEIVQYYDITLYRQPRKTAKTIVLSHVNFVFFSTFFDFFATFFATCVSLDVSQLENQLRETVVLYTMCFQMLLKFSNVSPTNNPYKQGAILRGVPINNPIFWKIQ